MAEDSAKPLFAVPAAVAPASSSSAAATLDIEAPDVVRLVLQYLKENNLTASFAALQEETSVTLNVVESTEVFVGEIVAGHWDAVLQTVAQLRLPLPKLVDLYEQIVLELMELKEIGAARSMLRQTDPLLLMKDRYPERYIHLEHLLARTYFDVREAYPEGSNKEKRRAEIAQALASEVTTVPPSRLLALLGQALKWQQHQGMLPPGTAFDVFRGTAPALKSEAEAIPKLLAATIKFGKKSHAECARFSPDGQFLVTGSSDGFVEVWNPMTGKLRKDLKYQAEDNFMLMEESVTAIAFSRDSDMLASAATDGMIKVWKLATGQCVRRIEKAHGQGVTCVSFSRDGSQVISGSFDQTIRVHGLKTGKLIKEFRGHTSFVNEALFTYDNTRVVSVSSDGYLKVWDSKSSECVASVRPKPLSAGAEPSGKSLHSLQLLMTPHEQFVVGERSSHIYVTSAKGQVVKVVTNDKPTVDFIASTVSPRGGFVHAVAEDGHLYSFNLETGRIEGALKVHDSEIIGLAVHPHINLIATYGLDGELRVWKAGSQ